MLSKPIWMLCAIFAVVVLSMSALHDQRDAFSLSSGASHGNNGILLLTAHPDDECMFFAPTLLALKHEDKVADGTLDELNSKTDQARLRPEVYSLCLSSGNADGLGETRKRELADSLDVLGVIKGKRWVLDEPFHDNITEFWDAKLIAEYVKLFVEEHKIAAILTFDERGISSHPNHISLERGIRSLLAVSSRENIRAFSLKTTALLPKYIGVAAAFISKLESTLCVFLRGAATLPVQTLTPLLEALRILDCEKYSNRHSRALFVSDWSQYVTALRAMRKHRSQLVWFRWLYVTFSRYMWVNEWTEIEVNSP